MTKKKPKSFNHQYMADNLPVAIFELQYHIDEQISRFNYLNNPAKELFFKILPKERLESGFDLDEILDVPEVQRRSREELIPILKKNPIVFNNRQYLINTFDGKQIVVDTDIQFSLVKDYIILRGIAKKTSKVIQDTKSEDIETIKQEINDFKQFFDAFDAMIMIANEEGRILFVSPNVDDNMLYKPREEILNKTLHEIFAKGQADFFLNSIHEAIKHDISVEYEYHLPVANKVKWYQSRIIPIEATEGEFRKVIAIIKDITSWKIKPIS
jgi:PAS domain S-box-containing protein